MTGKQVVYCLRAGARTKRLRSTRMPEVGHVIVHDKDRFLVTGVEHSAQYDVGQDLGGLLPIVHVTQLVTE